jgi:hypothetical protein
MVKRRVWRHQRGSQNLYIEDEQTTQWSKEEFEDTKGAARSHIPKMNRQHNGQRTSLKTPKGQPLTIVLSVRLRYIDSDYPFGVFKLFFWPLCCLFVFDKRILTTPLVSSNSSFDHCVVCSSSIYGFWLPLWCLQTLLLTIVLSVPLRYNDSGCPFVVFKLSLKTPKG